VMGLMKFLLVLIIIIIIIIIFINCKWVDTRWVWLFYISSSPVAVLVQFSGRLLTSVVGSKTENTFIIFSLFGSR
jgi:hypothetical protein